MHTLKPPQSHIPIRFHKIVSRTFKCKQFVYFEIFLSLTGRNNSYKKHCITIFCLYAQLHMDQSKTSYPLQLCFVGYNNSTISINIHHHTNDKQKKLCRFSYNVSDRFQIAKFKTDSYLISA